jgi:hypothetical protein
MLSLLFFHLLSMGTCLFLAGCGQVHTACQRLRMYTLNRRAVPAAEGPAKQPVAVGA